ncbi:MAG: TrmH family RNA methyltransferase [Chloroflexota bacterium]
MAPATDAAIRAARDLKTSQGRREQHRFLLEGVRLIGDMVDQGLPIHQAFITPHLLDATPRGRALGGRLRDLAVPLLELTERRLTLLTDTESPPGIVAVAPLPDSEEDLPPIGADGLGALLLDQVRDPGNLGGILRGAAAAGVSRIVTTEGSADPWGPKVVRSAAGAHMRVRLWPAQHREAVADWLGGWPQIALADGRSALTMYEVDWSRPTVLVLANEAHGPSPWLADLPVVRVAIPMRAATESLNVATATAILLYEARRIEFVGTDGP